MSKLLNSDADLRHLLENTKTIALVGASPKANRPSYGVMAFLQQSGYRVIPVNPVAAGSTILGETVYATLAEIGEPIDMVDVFRRAGHAEMLRARNVKVSRIARGVPLGGELEYVDAGTISQALLERREI